MDLIQRETESKSAGGCMKQITESFLVNPTTQSPKKQVEHESISMWRESQLTPEFSHCTKVSSRLPLHSTERIHL